MTATATIGTETRLDIDGVSRLVTYEDVLLVGIGDVILLPNDPTFPVKVTGWAEDGARGEVPLMTPWGRLLVDRDTVVGFLDRCAWCLDRRRR